MSSSNIKTTPKGSQDSLIQCTDWTIYNFNTQNDVSNLLYKLKLNHQNKSASIEKLKFYINEVEELNETNLHKLNEIFKNISIIILVSFDNNKNFQFYWKSSTIQQCLALKPFKERFSEDDKELYELVADFLANSLQNGHLGIHPQLDPLITKGQFLLHNLVDSRNYNLLLFASESGNAKPIEALLNYGIEPRVNLPVGEVTAQDLAWQGRHSNVLIKLCRANLLFPPQIDVNECSEELKRFIETCQEFHKMIEEQNKDRLNEIISHNPNLRHFYDLSNKSAVKAALDLKLIDMYEFLISKNLSFGPHEDTDDIWEQFERPDKIKLRNINFKYLKNIPEKHINVLMFNTLLSHDEADEEGKRKLILRAYKSLNSDSRLKIILKIVAATKIFKVIFDFHRDSTYRIDPTTGPWTQGIFYFSGRIIIGAKQLLDPETERVTFGVLIHELCHFAMLTVYQNQSDPFTENDKEAKEEFARISELCKANMEEERVIESVFEDYPEEHQPSELIVRPPQLIALYGHMPEILEEISQIFNELFDYYLNVVVPAMERALPEIEGRLAYRPAQTYEKLSEQDKEKVQNAVVKYKCVKVKFVELFAENSDIFVTLTADHISQMMGNKALNFDDPQFRYLEENIVLKWENLAGNLKEEILDLDLNFQEEIVKFKDLFVAYPDAFDALTSQQLIDVLSENELKIGQQFKCQNGFYTERNFILENARLLYFEYEYGRDYIDNSETRVNHVEMRIRDTNFEEVAEKNLVKSFDDQLQLYDKINQNLFFKTRFFDLNHQEFWFLHKDADDMIERAQFDRILVLSSEAGAGKTETFKQIAVEMKSKFPIRWVSYIDLPRHTELYRPNTTALNLLKQILDLNLEENNFEVRIFEECFKAGNLVLIWNGFDEISPTYNELILNVLKSIHETSSNVQFVCTRPIYSEQLSRELKIMTWQLIPFDDSKKQEFLNEFFTNQNISKEKIEENIAKVEEIIEKLIVRGEFWRQLNTPLMLKLIAEIHEDKKLFESANIYGIFEAFVEKKIEIWLEKSKSSFSIAKKLLFSGSLKIIFQKSALLYEFQLFSFTNLALKMRKLQIMQLDIPDDFPMDEISRIGILFLNGKNNFEFSHQTLSEFFVAQFFIENLFNINGAVDNDEAELRLELFHHLTKAYGDFQQIVTDFMTSYLQMRPQNPKNFNPTISKLLRTKFKNFFIRMLDTNCPKVFEFLFEFFKPDHDLLVDLLHVHESETFYTAIFNPNNFALFTDPEEIKRLARNCLTDAEFHKFVTGKNQKGKILFGIHIYGLLEVTKSHDAFETEIEVLKVTSFWDFFPKVKELLTVEEQKELFEAAISPKIYLYFDKLFSPADFSKYEKIWKIFENLLTQNEIQNAIGNAIISFFEIKPSDKAGLKKFLTLFLKKAEKFLSKSQIFEMFWTKSVFHEAHWDHDSFNFMWNFLKRHTNEDERKQILLQESLNDKTLYFWLSFNDENSKFSSFKYFYFNYNFTPFNIFQRSLTIRNAPTFKLTKNIYQNHFSKSEIQEKILNSNDFLYHVIGTAYKEPFEEFVEFLEELFKEDKKLLKELLERKIEPTNLSVFEFVEDFRGLPWSKENWMSNLKVLNDLYKKISSF